MAQPLHSSKVTGVSYRQNVADPKTYQGRAGVFAEWRDAMREIARRPNVLCKVSGLGLPFWGFGFENRSDPIGYEELAATWTPYVQTVIEIFGPDRCMMASDYPVDSRRANKDDDWMRLNSCANRQVLSLLRNESKRSFLSGASAGLKIEAEYEKLESPAN